MPLYEFWCDDCGGKVELVSSMAEFETLTGQPCEVGNCEGVLRRAWSFYVMPVSGGGGSPGHAVGGTE